MWNISRGFKFAHDVEDRQMEGKLGKRFRCGGGTSHFVEGFRLLRAREA